MDSRLDAAASVGALAGRRILVVGDLILDHYLEGLVERVSPEAPVPVVTLSRDAERSLPGGAANVAMNIRSLGSLPVSAGLVGDDEHGRLLRSLLSAAGADVSCVLTDAGRPTTTKTRIMARHQQILRIDREVSDPASPGVAAELERAVMGALDSVDAVVFEDYDKGCIHPGLVAEVISAAAARGIPVAVDPKFRNFRAYRGCSLLKPNRSEASRFTGMEIGDSAQASGAAAKILSETGSEAVLLTLGEQGAVLVEKGGIPILIPAAARRVFDVSGAGDTVISVMALAIAAGMPLRLAALLANYAAAAVCAEPGVYAVKPADILREIDAGA
ncbi:D-glycero-beta-D-manno-heptose-7-phosphate kinase [Candidatus Fermentibacteria bacterium]|nr:D-glycero-beta-D-manno-heptose-7-phosphate kinase [Candidatus Fermentibacteria bacterium]